MTTLRVVELLASLLALGLVLTRRPGGPVPGRKPAAAAFAVIALSVGASFFQAPDEQPPHWLSDVLGVLVLSLPFTLAQLSHELGASGRRLPYVAGATTGALALVLVLSPEAPPPGAPRSAAWLVYTAVALLAWVLLSVVTVRDLRREAARHVGVVGQRLRLLAVAVLTLAAAVALLGLGGSPDGTGQHLAASVGLLAVVLLVGAFLPPSALRALWRRDDLLLLRQVEDALVRAEDPRSLTDELLPLLARLVGGKVRLRAPGDRAASASAWTLPLGSDVLDVDLPAAAPVLGSTETALVRRVASLLAVALDRSRAHEAEVQARAAAERASHELETLLYSVSHDLRSPLVSVMGYVDCLREEGDALSDDARHYLDRVEANAGYMQSLVVDLLELSRVGRTDGPAQTVDLAGVVRQVSSEVAAQHPGLRVEAGPLPALRADPVRVQQVVTNLLENAAVHAGPDVRVSVTARAEPDGGCAVRVEDDGPGIPVEYRELVFGVFERLATGTRQAGTGIGLAVCRRVIETWGGSTSVEDGAAGGAAVVLHLPPTALAGSPR